MSKHPVGLPKGSVRAILAIMVVLGWLVTGIVPLIHGEYGRAFDMLREPPTLVIAVIAYYFAYRTISKMGG